MRETPLSGRGTPQDLLLRRLPEAPTSEGAPGEGAMGLRHNVFVPLPQGSPAPPGGAPSLSPREGASFREAVEGMCLYALELDAQGGVVFCNAFLLHVAGWDLGSVRGKNWFDDLRSPDNPMPGERFRLGLRRGFIPPHHEGTFLSHWGGRRRVRWHNTVLRDDEGRVTGILSLGEDLTEQRRAEWEERKARIQAEALNKVVRAVGAHQDMDELLCRVDQQLNRFMEVPCLMVALGHPEWRVVYRRGGQDRSPEPFPGEWAFFDRVLREGKPLHLPDGRGGGALGPHLEGLLKTTEVHSVMAAPLVFGDRTLGVMMALSTDSDLVYSSDDMAFFAAAASPVALALENSRLFTEMGNLAMTDALTGVANRRSLFMLGEHEISRAVRRRSPISFFMLDLDHFKNVNDRHGHRVGDGVLRHVAQICRRSLREEDLLGRYGGEEFVVVLPDTGYYEAWSVAERLRGAVEEAPFHLEGRPLPITISVGVSTLPGGSPRIPLEAILDQADQALYEAKRAGRNAVAGAPLPDHFVDTARLSSLRRRQST